MKKLYVLTGVLFLFSLLQSSLAVARNVTIVSSGVGKVRIGLELSKLPEHLSGIYDKIELISDGMDENGAYEDSTPVYRATMGDDAVLDIYPYDGKVYSISVYSDVLKTSHGLSVNSRPEELFGVGGKVISFNDGGEAILCDGVLFKGMPMTEQGYKKSEQAYLGYDVSFDLSDFVTDGHSSEIVVSEFCKQQGEAMASSGQSTINNASGGDVVTTILGIIFLIAILAMIGHMVYVHCFLASYPEDFDPAGATPENDSYVKEKLYSLCAEFTPLGDSGEKIDYPVGKKVAYHAKDVMDDIVAKHLPVEGDTIELLKNVSHVTNNAYERTFAGSKTFIGISILVGIGMCCLNKNAYPLIYFGLSCVMYWLSCLTPNYILIEKKLKSNSGRQSQGLMSGVMDGIWGLSAKAPVYVTVHKEKSIDDVVFGGDKDYSVTVGAMVASIVMYVVCACLMSFVGIINYLRNYVLRK